MNDPLTDLCFGDTDSIWLSQQITDVADRYAEGRIVSTLEGGYQIAALAHCATLHVRALAGLSPVSAPA